MNVLWTKIQLQQLPSDYLVLQGRRWRNWDGGDTRKSITVGSLWLLFGLSHTLHQTILLKIPQLTFQFVIRKDFSNLVSDSWLCSSRLECHVPIYHVWRQMNWTSSRMAIRIAMFSNTGFFCSCSRPLDGSKILLPFAQKTFGFYKLILFFCVHCFHRSTLF